MADHRIIGRSPTLRPAKDCGCPPFVPGVPAVGPPCPDDRSWTIGGLNGTGRPVGYIAEFANVAVIADVTGGANADASSSTLTTSSITPTAGHSALMVAGFNFGCGDSGTRTLSDGTLTMTDWTLAYGGFSPLSCLAYRVIPSTSGPYTGTVTASVSASYANAVAMFLASGGSPTLVQYGYITTLGSAVTPVLPSAPTTGNLLVGFLADRAANGNPVRPDGWTTIAHTYQNTSGLAVNDCLLFYKVACEVWDPGSTGTPTAGQEVFDETITPATDGTTAFFWTTYPYRERSLRIYVDGINVTNDLNENDPLNGGFSLAFAPAADDVIMAEYQGAG